MSEAPKARLRLHSPFLRGDDLVPIQASYRCTGDFGAESATSLVAVLVTTAGLMFVRLTLTGRLGAILGEGVLSAENWAALAPELLWPLWGAALGAATLAYYYRRRGKCEHCGLL